MGPAGASRPLLAALVLLLWTCAAAARKPRDIAASGQTQFGLDMYMMMSDRDHDSNLVFSPVSICTGLAMTYAGSSGETSQQMADVLHYPERRRVVMRGHRGLLRKLKTRYGGDVQLRMTNRLYAARRLRLRRKFTKQLNRIFGSTVQTAPFSRPSWAARIINDHVRNDTAGRIDSLVTPGMLGGQTRLVLVNAVYFKAAWETPFDRLDTTTAPFHAPGGVRQVQMMRTRQQWAFGRHPALRSRVLAIPYQGGRVHMVVILPFRKNGLAKMEAALTKTTMRDVFSMTKISYEIDVRLPRFNLQEEINLKKVLQAMGIEDLFDASRADLSGFSRDDSLYATDAVHKAVITVNEEGSEAAAATGITIGNRIRGPRPPPFVVDHPFMFALYDAKLDLTLFVGRVADPTK